MDKAIVKYFLPTLFSVVSLTLLSGCVTQSFENDEPIVKTQANRDEMAATRISLGLGYLNMGDMSQAKLNLEKAKQFSPKLVQVHTAFAHFYETVGESTLAIESFEQALSLKADSADTLNNYGVFLCRQGKVDAAEVQFLKAIAVPSYLLVAQSYENLSSCYLQNDDFEKAEMYLNKAIFHSPNRTTTLLQMVRLKYAMTDYKEAKVYLQKFERNTQRFTADSLALSYKVYRKLGQRRTAANYGNMLVKMYPQSWEGKQYLLNELEFIEADDLARKYKLTQRNKNQELPSSSTKRVVKLSPKKRSITANTKTSVPNVVKTVPVSSQVAAGTAQTAAIGGNALTTAAVAGATVAGSIVATTPLNSSSEEGVGKNAATNVSEAPLENSAVGNSSEVLVENSPVTTGTAVTKGSTSNSDSLVGAAVITAAVVSNESATNNEEKSQQVNDSATVTENEVVTSSSSLEPTSTQPIAATRDVPLPEALPQAVEVAMVTAPVVIAQKAITEEPTEITQKPLVEENEKETVIASDMNSETSEELAEDSMRIVDVDDALHTIEPGQNLYNISVKYNVKLDTLRKWNDISENNKIRIGDKLFVVDPQTVKKH